jgi:probable HAF family extracellular repeat protein
MQDLGTLGGSQSEAYGVSADGSVVVGSAQNTSGGYRAFRWTASGGMEDLNTTYASLLTDGSQL